MKRIILLAICLALFVCSFATATASGFANTPYSSRVIDSATAAISRSGSTVSAAVNIKTSGIATKIGVKSMILYESDDGEVWKQVSSESGIYESNKNNFSHKITYTAKSGKKYKVIAKCYAEIGDLSDSREASSKES